MKVPWIDTERKRENVGMMKIKTVSFPYFFVKSRLGLQKASYNITVPNIDETKPLYIAQKVSFEEKP